jgi:hypothetical protein
VRIVAARANACIVLALTTAALAAWGFYVAANAANGDGTRLGDFVYTASWAIAEVTTSVVTRTWSTIKHIYAVKR